MVGSGIIRLLGLVVPGFLAVAGWICSILSASPSLPWMDERVAPTADYYTRLFLTRKTNRPVTTNTSTHFSPAGHETTAAQSTAILFYLMPYGFPSKKEITSVQSKKKDELQSPLISRACGPSTLRYVNCEQSSRVLLKKIKNKRNCKAH